MVSSFRIGLLDFLAMAHHNRQSVTTCMAFLDIIWKQFSRFWWQLIDKIHNIKNVLCDEKKIAITTRKNWNYKQKKDTVRHKTEIDRERGMKKKSTSEKKDRFPLSAIYDKKFSRQAQKEHEKKPRCVLHTRICGIYRYPYVHRCSTQYNKHPSIKMHGKKSNNFNLQLIKLTKIWRHVQLMRTIKMSEKNLPALHSIHQTVRQLRLKNWVQWKKNVRTPQMQQIIRNKNALKTKWWYEQKTAIRNEYAPHNTCINYTSRASQTFEKRSAFRAFFSWALNVSVCCCFFSFAIHRLHCDYCLALFVLTLTYVYVCYVWKRSA